MRIAIAGGIGSGKSEALKVAKDLGFATLSADEINSGLLLTPSYIQKIEKLFPSAVVDEQIDRKALARIVFADNSAREKLNAVAHPLIIERIQDDTRSPLVVEVPLIVESGAAKLFDEIIFVKTPREKRVERLIDSRGMTQDEVEARISAQVGDEVLETIATKVVINDSTLDSLRKKLADILKNF